MTEQDDLRSDKHRLDEMEEAKFPVDPAEVDYDETCPDCLDRSDVCSHHAWMYNELGFVPVPPPGDARP